MANVIKGTGSQFFPDQQVHSADLNNIQFASIGMMRNYLKSITKTPGVYLNNFTDADGLIPAGGMLVRANPKSSNTTQTLSIDPGIACDPQGYLITIPTFPTVASGSISADPEYYPARPARTYIDPGVGASGTKYINVYYTPTYGMSEPDDSGVQHYTRVYDSYRIEFENTAATTEGLNLARAVFTETGDLAVTTDSTGYLATDGKRYALYDTRVGYEVYDREKGSMQAEVDALNAAVFDEELELTTAFIFPADGHSIVTKIHRDATILRMELYMELQSGESGTVSFQLYTGQTANTLGTGPIGQLETSTPNVVAVSADLNLTYQKGYPLKFVLVRADDSVIRTTASIVYKRR